MTEEEDGGRPPSPSPSPGVEASGPPGTKTRLLPPFYKLLCPFPHPCGGGVDRGGGVTRLVLQSGLAKHPKRGPGKEWVGFSSEVG